jgi:hypothetical protein
MSLSALSGNLEILIFFVFLLVFVFFLVRFIFQTNTADRKIRPHRQRRALEPQRGVDRGS